MDRYLGPARLEWWANDSICIDQYDIDITVTVDAENTWRAAGRHAVVLDGAKLEGWDFLVAMDPYFSLAFLGEDRGRITVRVDETEDAAFTLTEAADWNGSGSVTFGPS